jgi:hypothetical protein
LTQKGNSDLHYWSAFWGEGDKTQNEHLGSTRKIDSETARQKARTMKLTVPVKIEAGSIFIH